jgi:uncharacterized protein (DUF736 family)
LIGGTSYQHSTATDKSNIATRLDDPTFEIIGAIRSKRFLDQGENTLAVFWLESLLKGLIGWRN